jgi:4-alpha-glucanotransferase
MNRSCGILCHPTSLPSPYGIGDLGAGAYALLDFLSRAGQSLWQVLPLGPTGYGDSPYQPFSAFAGNPLLIDPEPLRAEGLLDDEDLSPWPPFPPERVSYGDVIAYKGDILRRAFQRLQDQPENQLNEELAAFCAQHTAWLDDYALFMALKVHHAWAVWTRWPADLVTRQRQALAHWRAQLAEEIAYRQFEQFIFDMQWRALKEYAHDAGISILGDMPIFVGHDSADVWSHQELYQLDEHGQPLVVAGVPPDYFSATGQLWGNPLYRWEAMRADGYAWWIARLRRALDQVDRVRLDHFRGFAGYWEVPAGQPTALNGHWVQGPGEELFAAVRAALGGQLPIVAEDLGLISQDVDALRNRLGLPGMRVLQFAFDSDADNEHLPHNLPVCCVLYTATHDNDTTLGWYNSREPGVRARADAYCGISGPDAHWALIRVAYTAVAELAVIPLQDALGLGNEARLNQPGRPDGNWSWRFQADQLAPDLADALRGLAILTGRYWEEEHDEAKGAHITIDYATQ